MAIDNYRDFILVADDVSRTATDEVESFVTTVFDSPVGQGTNKERVTVTDDLAQRIRWLEKRQLDEDRSKQIELGEILGSLLLPPYARRLFSESLKRLRQGEGLRLRLRLAEGLADFPWEYSYLADAAGARDAAGFSSLDPRISIVRHESLEIPADWFEVPGDWFEPPPRRRILVAMASPTPHTTYRKLEHLPEEQKSIQEALKDIDGVDVALVPQYSGEDDNAGVTVRSLADALQSRTDVFHFSGHGEFPKMLSGGDAALIFADDQNRAFPVSSQKLADLLRGKGVRLAVLGSCETGRRDGRNVWSGVVSSLLRAGIPAVVAMQFTIDDKLAAGFSRAFYRALTAGLSVDEAVAAGRIAIRVEAAASRSDIRDWGVPVLYLRAQEGRIFNPVGNEAAVRKALEMSGHLIEQQVKEIDRTGRIIGAVADSVVSESITVEQKVDEDMKGLLVGASVFAMEGGQLRVKQKLGKVSGTVVGAQIGALGARRSGPKETAPNALAQLEKLLRLD